MRCGSRKRKVNIDKVLRSIPVISIWALFIRSKSGCNSGCCFRDDEDSVFSFFNISYVLTGIHLPLAHMQKVSACCASDINMLYTSSFESFYSLGFEMSLCNAPDIAACHKLKSELHNSCCVSIDGEFGGCALMSVG